MPDGEPVSVTPAQLSFLAIYNPSLGTTDETLDDQIVFYSSKATRSWQKSSAVNDAYPSEEGHDDTNQRLRQIGLAQGMVNFAKNFSEGKPVDSIDTEKSRVVLHELEPNWWILASIDLTRLPVTGGTISPPEPSTSPRIEYSSREVCPPHFLIQQLRRAHSIFLLHHANSLDTLYRRVGRPTFCRLLHRFWTRFTRNWVVRLNGNPAVNIFNGVKLAVGGELGIGVGEEEWGSGEREVLEDFVSRTHGLVDLVVSRFGDVSASQVDKSSTKEPATEQPSWLGSDQCPQPSDGVIFSGAGAISRTSLCQVSHWMEWIYRYGEAAYGVGENPSSVRRRKQRIRTNAAPNANLQHQAKSGVNPQSGRTSPGIPPPLVVAAPPPQDATAGTSQDELGNTHTTSSGTEDSPFGTDALMKYLTLGYGSAWKFPSMSANGSVLRTGAENKDEASTTDTLVDETPGKFIIGLTDDLEEETSDAESAGDSFPLPSQDQEEGRNRRTVLRTLQLKMAESSAHENNTEPDSAEGEHYKKLQVLVYVRRPFMFTFLFDLHTPSLTLPSFYRSIHHQLGPLQKPLLSSTSPLNVSRRIFVADCDAGSQKRASPPDNPIYDLVYDSGNLTVRSSIPNIPDPAAVSASSPERVSTVSVSERSPHWSRVEALNVHNQFLSTYTDTRSRPMELERTCKTSRGWWLVWVRIYDDMVTAGGGDASNRPAHPAPIEAFLIRKASEAVAAGARHGPSSSSSGVRFLRDLSGASPTGSGILHSSSNTSGTASSGKLAEGLGFDAQRYIESLLSLNR